MVVTVSPGSAVCSFSMAADKRCLLTDCIGVRSDFSLDRFCRCLPESLGPATLSAALRSISVAIRLVSADVLEASSICAL